MSMDKFYVLPGADALIAEKDALLRSVSAGFTERGERIAKLEKALTECFEVCEYCRPHAAEALKP